MEQNAQSNPFASLHKSKLYVLILAAVGLITVLLPWYHITANYGAYSLGSYSRNGFASWPGILAFISFIGAGVVPFFMGDKTKPFEGQQKMIETICFAAAAVFGLLRILIFMHALGFGIFLCIIVGAAGALFVQGKINLPAGKK